MRIIIEINNNALNEKRFIIWEQSRRSCDDIGQKRFAKVCATKKEAIEIVAQFLAEIPIAHYPIEAEEAYKKLIGVKKKP